MTLWLDEQLSPRLARWIKERFALDIKSMWRLGKLHTEDDEIFAAARIAGAVIMTKDQDFVRLLNRYGAPPQILLLTFGNRPEAELRRQLDEYLPGAILRLEAGEDLVEIP